MAKTPTTRRKPGPKVDEPLINFNAQWTEQDRQKAEAISSKLGGMSLSACIRYCVRRVFDEIESELKAKPNG